MHRRCASWYAVPLHTPSGVLHKNAFSDEALFRFTPQYEASLFHSDMKHSAYAPYDLSSIALRATDDEKMKNESYVCKYSLSTLYYSVERKNLLIFCFKLKFPQTLTIAENYQKSVIRSCKPLQDTVYYL